MRWWFVLIPFFLVSCANQPVAVDNGVPPLPAEEYEALIQNHTAHTNQFAGVYQTFQADMTILTSDVRTASLRQRAFFLQWDNKQYLAEREKMMQENAAYAKFFLRFYSPEHDYDDLHKGKTIWKVYLDVSGQRFEGKVRKLTEKFVELKTLYPHLDRFSTPYEVTFSVPMSTVETGGNKVTLTSSLGTAEFVFPVKK
jgi:hypothetical protein